jgi:diguanylate cyclase (GGDEF)-like protein
VVADLDRLGPIVKKCFAPQPIIGVRSYLAGIAEIRHAPTRAILVGYDPHCRKPEAALAAMKAVAGGVPVVFCCDPAYEHLGRRLVGQGVDDYLIFPPESAELEQSLGIPGKRTQRRWLDAPAMPPTPSAEELARLADVMPRLAAGDPGTLDALAALVCAALNAEHALILIDGRTGHAARESATRAGRETPARAAPAAADRFNAIIVEPITDETQRVGQIRLGRSLAGGYTHEDTLKLRHYGVLFGRMLAGCRRAEEWRRLALTDDLTGLANRRRLLEFLDEKLPLAGLAHSTVTVLYFDIDDFKRYNDAYGHDAGDEILRDIGRLFVKCSRENDLVARYGGDEFIVVFWEAEAPRTPGSRHPAGVHDVVMRFREALRKHTFKRLGPEATGCLTISGGIAHFPWDARTAAELIETADRALLQAKAAGKNRFYIVGADV